MSWVSDVLEFHRQLGLAIGDVPHIPKKELMDLRKELIREEYEELMGGIEAGDLLQIADGAIDLIYVTIGLLISMGIDPDPIWREVQRTNMRKVGGGQRADGKLLKPEGWEPPNLNFVARRLPRWSIPGRKIR